MIDNINSIIEKYNADMLFKLIIWAQILDHLWDFYLSWRQRRVYKTVTVIPTELIGIIDTETFEKSRAYALDKSDFKRVQWLVNFVATMVILAKCGLYWMWVAGGYVVKVFGYNPDSNELLQTAAYVVVLQTFNTVVKMPFSVYDTFYLEEKYGFNKQTPSFFVKDKIKAYILGVIISVPVAVCITYIVQIGGEYFFIYLWLFVMALTFFLMTIYPDLIAPMFDKYMPLEEGELRQEIENLAASIKFPLKKLYVVEGSKRSFHSNAYFYGFFNNKRIVLFDTLIKKPGDEDKKGCDKNEILAVLGHELGHWKLNHVLKNIIISQINTFLVFFMFKTLFQHRPLYEALGFEHSTPILVGLMASLQYVMTPYFTVLGLGMALMSRRFEFAADQFAKSLGREYALRAALIKLNTDNLSFPIYDSLYSTWHNSHPPLIERLQALHSKDE